MWKWILVLLLAAPAAAEDAFTVSTPEAMVVDEPTGYELSEFTIRTWPDIRIDMHLCATRADGQCARDQYGECQRTTTIYTGQPAVLLINELNSADLTTLSLRHRILARLMADGVLPAGGITGAADLPTMTPTATPTATWTVTATWTATETATATP